MAAEFAPIAFYIAFGICGLACLACVFIFLAHALYTPSFTLFATEWRGLGGGLGGLRISSALGAFVLAIVFATLTVSLVETQIGAQRDAQRELHAATAAAAAAKK